MEQGLIQVYTGKGKGKTTAAVGLTVRALGQNLRVLWARFLKPIDPVSGEVAFLQGAANLEIFSAGVGILGPAPDVAAAAASVRRTFDLARQRILADACDLAVFDELNNALHKNLLPLNEVLELCDAKPAGVELVFTGRHAPEALLARADLVTRMEPVKHPYQHGIAARRGIEY